MCAPSEGQRSGSGAMLWESFTGLPATWTSPSLGAHTHEILAADLGLSDAELADLRAEKVIA